MGVPLDSYASACTGFELELIESLTTEDQDELRKDCKSLKVDKWYSWANANHEMILDFLAATPSFRKKKKAWKDPVLRRRLTLAALQYLNGAHGLLESAADLALHVGASYRDMARMAADKYLEILSVPYRHWPLDEPNPFR